MAIVVLAEMKFAPGHEDEAMAAFEKLCAATHAKDDGCLLYAMHRVEADPSRAVMIEKWESMDALQAHAAAEHSKEIGEFGHFAERSRITILNPAELGDPGKGAL